MRKDKKLTDLKNIGTKLAMRLNKIGVYSESDLRKLGAVMAHKKLKAIHPDESLSVCYYLYSFEGALSNKHWNDLSKKKKSELCAQIQP